MAYYNDRNVSSIGTEIALKQARTSGNFHLFFCDIYTNNACVHGSTNGTNGILISFKVLLMVPLVIRLVPMVPLVKTDGSQYYRQSTVLAKLPTLESHMIQYGVLNFKFINFTFFSGMILANDRNTEIVRCIDHYISVDTVGLTNGTIGTTNGTNGTNVSTNGTIGCRETFRVLWLPMVLLATNGNVGKISNGSI